TQGCDPSADSSADRVGQFRLSHQPYCWPERGKSQGYGDSVPISKRSLPNSKKSSKKTLTKGGESSSRMRQRRQGPPRGRGRPPHMTPQNAGYLSQADTPLAEIAWKRPVRPRFPAAQPWPEYNNSTY